MIQVKWTGEMSTRAEIEKGGAKLDLEPNQKFSCTKETFKLLNAVDKRFQLCGGNDEETMKDIAKEDKEAKPKKKVK